MAYTICRCMVYGIIHTVLIILHTILDSLRVCVYYVFGINVNMMTLVLNSYLLLCFKLYLLESCNSLTNFSICFVIQFYCEYFLIMFLVVSTILYSMCDPKGNIREWRDLFRYGIQYLHLEDGTNIAVGNICIPKLMSR